MGAKLLYRDAQGRDAAADLPDSGAFLGRAVECVVRTDDAMVSRRNCKISVQGGRWYVEDLGSANGTYITTGSTAERRIQRDGLVHGDVIRCGSLQVRFVEVADPAAPIVVPQKPTVPTGPTPNGIPAANSVARPPASASGKEDKSPPGGDKGASGERQAVEAKPSNEEIVKLQEEYKKVVGEFEEATGALKEAQEQREQAVTKLESMELEVKRLRNDLSSTKEALEKLSRQAKKDKDELSAENKVNEELRVDLKQLRDSHNKVLSQLEEFKTQGEAKDRQIAGAGEDVRRAKKEVEGLNAQLVKLARERDEQIRNMNSQRGDVDHLRDILKEREKIIEEQRVGMVNQEAQLKDLKRRTEEIERELADVKGKYDNLKDRYTRGQSQIEELHQLLASQQQGGGESILHVTQENRTLRQDLQNANDELTAQSEQLKKLQTELANIARQRDQLSEEKKGAAQAGQAAHEEQLQQAVAQAVDKAVAQAIAQTTEKTSAELKVRHEAEIHQLAEQRDNIAEERDQLKARLNDSSSATAQQKSELAELAKERDQLAVRIAEVEEKFKSAVALTQSIPASSSMNSNANVNALNQQAAEIKAVATSAYDGISDAFGGLRKNLVDLEEAFNKVERGLADKETARRFRMSLEEVNNCFDDARSQIRSLRAVIE